MKLLKTIVLVSIFVLSFVQIALADVTYTVREGETADDIARKFGASLELFLEHNNIDNSDSLIAGSKVLIPYAQDIEPQSVPPTIEYSVAQGDNLSKIASDFDCDISEILSLNNLQRSAILSIGQILLIPNSEYTGESDSESVFVEPTEVQIDVDAARISGKNLLDLSQLDDAKITITEPDKEKHVVITQIDLPAREAEQSNRTSIFQKPVEIPGQEPSEAKASSTPTRRFIHHRVKKGESIHKIAQNYDVSPSDILKENKLTSKSVLRIGQTLKVPLSKDAEARFERVERQTESQLISRKLAPRDQLVRYALDHTGVRYRYGGSDLGKGVDCSGYVLKVYEKYGIKLPHSSDAQAQLGQKVTINELIPGDLVFFKSDKSKTISHVGIYIGNGKFVHAATSAKRVQVDDLSSEYYKRNYVTARRVF